MATDCVCMFNVGLRMYVRACATLYVAYVFMGVRTIRRGQFGVGQFGATIRSGQFGANKILIL